MVEAQESLTVCPAANAADGFKREYGTKDWQKKVFFCNCG
jgi:hypothetical protein